MRILLFTSINFSLGLRITSLQEYFHQHNAIPVENYSQGIRNSLKQCLRQDHAIPLNEKVYVNTETIVNFVCLKKTVTAPMGIQSAMRCSNFFGWILLYSGNREAILHTRSWEWCWIRKIIAKEPLTSSLDS